MTRLYNDQLVGDSINERLEEIDIHLDNGSIPAPGWQELHDERDILFELRYAITDALNIAQDEISAYLITETTFADKHKLKLGTIHATVTFDNGDSYHISDN